MHKRYSNRPASTSMLSLPRVLLLLCTCTGIYLQSDFVGYCRLFKICTSWTLLKLFIREIRNYLLVTIIMIGNLGLSQPKHTNDS